MALSNSWVKNKWNKKKLVSCRPLIDSKVIVLYKTCVCVLSLSLRVFVAWKWRFEEDETLRAREPKTNKSELSFFAHTFFFLSFFFLFRSVKCYFSSLCAVPLLSVKQQSDCNCAHRTFLLFFVINITPLSLSTHNPSSLFPPPFFLLWTFQKRKTFVFAPLAALQLGWIRGRALRWWDDFTCFHLTIQRSRSELFESPFEWLKGINVPFNFLYRIFYS